MPRIASSNTMHLVTQKVTHYTSRWLMCYFLLFLTSNLLPNFEPVLVQVNLANRLVLMA